MATSHIRRVRLSIDVDLELRRRLKIAAASRDLSVRDYVEGVLRGALEFDARGEEAAEQGAWREGDAADRPLTPAEQDRGLRTLTELEQLDRALLERRGGKPFPSSWELLDRTRTERTRDLRRDE
jgi:hypothetical protein